MFRISIYFIVVLVSLSCSRRNPSFDFADLTQRTHSLTGRIEMRGKCSNRNCEQVLKEAILDKFLYQGFEGTSYWRPRMHSGKSLSKELRKNLIKHIYIMDSYLKENPEVSVSDFQLNLNSILILLEHESVILPLGY